MNNMSHHNNDHHQHHYGPQQQQQQQFLQHQGHNHDFDHPEMTPTNMLTTAATTTMMSTNGIMDDNGNMMIDKNHHHGLHQQQSSAGSQRTMMMTTGSMDHMGKMYFHFGYEPIVLFEQWSADTFWSMFFTCLFFFMVAILYELLKAYRRIHSARLIRRVGRRSIVTKSSQMPTMGMGTAEEDAAMTAAAALDSGGEETAGEENPTMKITKFSHPNYGMRASTANNNNNNHDTESGSSSSSCRNHHTITNNNNGGGGDGGLTSSINPILPTLIFEGSSTTTAATIGLPSNNVPLFVRSLQEMFNIWHIYSTLLYMLQVIFAYYLMLAFMLFNVWICLAIILGAALGHFLLAEQNMALPMDNIVEDYCH